MLISARAEPKSNWAKGRLSLGLRSRRWPRRLRIVAQVLIATLLVAVFLKMHEVWILFKVVDAIHVPQPDVFSVRHQGKTLEAKLSTEAGIGNDWCSLQKEIWICTEVSGHKVQGRDDPTPRPDCLGGFESWGVCQDGKFLCKTEKTEPLAGSHSNTDAVANSPTCALRGGRFSCTNGSGTKQAHVCLDSVSSAGICLDSDRLCCATRDQCPLGEKPQTVPIVLAHCAMCEHVLRVTDVHNHVLLKRRNAQTCD